MESDWDDLDYLEGATSADYGNHRPEPNLSAQEHVAEPLFGTSLLISPFGPSPHFLSWPTDAPHALLTALPTPSSLMPGDGMRSWMQKTGAHAAQQSGASWALPWRQILDVNDVEQILQELDQSSEWTACIPARSPIQTMDQAICEWPPRQDAMMVLQGAGVHGQDL
ncbi:hypothetical protein LTR17_012205 [Elasticomyces elasticus]|nr:hypothetical protein LTR17_012205 [Elasticomyces elasticus]